MRIFTGAPLPAGADVIVVQEEVARDGDTARLNGEGPTRIGAHIRPAGQDFAAGGMLLCAGKRLTPAGLGLAAAGGWRALPVVRRPRVTLIATGDELVLPGEIPGPGQIVSSNPAMLTALLRSAGADVHDPGLIPDDRAALAAALQAADADLIITIGGASVGDHDLVVPVLRELGADIDFWKIALRPGKPLLAGRLDGTRVLGLPGNPVSAFVTALLFAVPLVSRMAGRAHDLPLETLPLATPCPPTVPAAIICGRGGRRPVLSRSPGRTVRCFRCSPVPSCSSSARRTPRRRRQANWLPALRLTCSILFSRCSSHVPFWRHGSERDAHP